MSVTLKVTTTTKFPDIESVENFLRNSGAFQPHQVIELLEEKSLLITEDRDMQEIGTIAPTENYFKIEEN